MIKYALNNSLGQIIYISTSNHLLYQIVNDEKDEDNILDLLVEEQLKACLSNNHSIKKKVYYKVNSNKSNTKLILTLEDKSNIKFDVNFKNIFLSSNQSFVNQVDKTTLFLFPNEIKYECDKKLYELDIELSYNKKLKPLGE